MADGFGSSGKLSARYQHLPAAGETAYADVSAQPGDAPLVSATGMRFAHLHHIVQSDIGGVNHGSLFPSLRRLVSSTSRGSDYVHQVVSAVSSA